MRTCSAWTYAVTALVSFASLTSAASVCNGHAEYCDRAYSNVTVVGTHNSYSVQSGSIAANQNFTVTTQLENGIRLLQVQGSLNNGELHLCHTSCFLLDAGTFTSYLTEVKNWMDDNPNEVLTLIMVNSDGVSPATWAASYTAAGIDTYAYTPDSVPIAYSAWPTLGSLIDSNKRLISFLAQQADVSVAPFLLDEFTNVWETPYDETDDSFPCTVNRVTGSYEGKMYMANHFLNKNLTLAGQVIPVPDTGSLKSTNAASGGTSSLGANAASCLASWGYNPTFVLVDYYDVGDVFKFQAAVNGVSYTAKSIGSASGSNSASGAKATGKTTNSNNGSVTSTSLNGAANKSDWQVKEMFGLIVLVTLASGYLA